MFVICYIIVFLCILDCGWNEDGVECWVVRYCCGGRGWDGGGVSSLRFGNCYLDRRFFFFIVVNIFLFWFKVKKFIFVVIFIFICIVY